MAGTVGRPYRQNRPGRAVTDRFPCVDGVTGAAGVRSEPVAAVVLAEVARALLGPPVGVLLDHVVEQLLHALAVGDLLEHGRAALAGRLDRQRARVDDPVPQRLPVGDVGDPGQADVAAAAGQDALAEQQPVGGDHVVRGPPPQQRARARR